MGHRIFRYHSGWEWIHLLQSDEHSYADLKRTLPDCANWLDECEGRSSNHAGVSLLPGGSSVLNGTIMVQISDDESDIQPLHYWVSQERLVTIHQDLRIPIRLQSPLWAESFECSNTAPEALMVVLGLILESFHSGMDEFEAKLNDLENTMRKRNRTDLMDSIFERRYDLLHWSQLFIPVQETQIAAREAFLSGFEETDSYSRLRYKMERIEGLLKHYSLQIDTLISMDDAISNFRGTDIMKTLTIFTAVFMPAGIIGALWGMNFQWIPFLKDSWGFTVIISITLAFTVGIYLWLWFKGWTGDLLKGKHYRSKLIAASQSGRKQREPVAAKNKETAEVDNTETAIQLTRSRKKRTGGKSGTDTAVPSFGPRKR
ncbi:magnesium transporter CorA family protein [Paenibacillus sp. GCM10012307]|uniref:Magnesium transporter CorA family protein n=1 Tax=Paenibacillus roseus TaxID=2798579 RepID=A0A934MNT1_9BACL|nr:magnesium transporter CorA family protein [Paenibacillus roseus]MBJ6361346.1 magnesium transporter CorA family protein [Paenibacillus roseus]